MVIDNNYANNMMMAIPIQFYCFRIIANLWSEYLKVYFDESNDLQRDFSFQFHSQPNDINFIRNNFMANGLCVFLSFW